MTTNPLSLRVLTALLFLTPILATQDGSVPRTTRLEGHDLVNVKFPGGTLLELVELLRAQNETVNIVCPELAAKVPVPPMQLRAVTAESALRAASTVIEKQFDLNVQSIGQPNGLAVLALRVQERIRNVMNPTGMVNADETRVEVFSLRAITQPQLGEPEGIVLRTATVLTAIDTGLGFAASGGKPSIKFHEDSGLLFVSATHEQLQLVSSVLGQLERGVASARADAARKASRDAAETGATKDQQEEKPKTGRDAKSVK